MFKAPGTGLYRCEVHALSEEQAECANQVAGAVASQMELAEGVATRVLMAPEPFHKAHAAHQAYLHRAKGRAISKVPLSVLAQEKVKTED